MQAGKNDAFIVVGLGYGDEGKGLVVDYLSRKLDSPIVIRYNGGHQAGHCVVNENQFKHVFSNFGSGTLRNIPTYWSAYCTFAPTFFINEYKKLKKFAPKVFIDLNCPITTHYDVLYNRALEYERGDRKLGSCGVGYGATIDRERDNCNFNFYQLINDEEIEQLLIKIRHFYSIKFRENLKIDFNTFNHNQEDSYFLSSINVLKKLMQKETLLPVEEYEIFDSKYFKNYIFEGAQGILLDQNFGDKPFITKSNTTSQNAISLLNKYDFKGIVEVLYVTRCYQTRHGNGPFNDHRSKLVLYNFNHESNKHNHFQGSFKLDFLDIDKINYAIKCDDIYSHGHKKNLVLTCLDQILSDEITYYKNKVLSKTHYKELYTLITENFKNVLYSFSNCSMDL